MGLHKIIKIVGLILSLIGVIILGMMILKGDNDIKETGWGVDAFINTAFVMLSLVVIAVVFFGLKGLMSGNIKKCAHHFRSFYCNHWSFLRAC